MSPKPAYEALRKLIKGTWWMGEKQLTTDAAGKVTFRGYLGDYEVADGVKKAGFCVGESGKATAGVALK